MVCFVFAQILFFLLDLFITSHSSDHQKDLQIVLLRQQIRILQRKSAQPPRISRWEKCALAVLAARLKSLSKAASTRAGAGAGAGAGLGKRLDEVILLFKPDTVLKWHRELVRRKWTYKRTRSGGRPPVATELEELLVRLATENARWGYSKIQGELLKLGYSIGRSTIRDVLKRRHIPPAPQRKQHGSTWRNFLGHYANQILACDFFTVETACLKTLYALFFIGTPVKGAIRSRVRPSLLWERSVFSVLAGNRKIAGDISTTSERKMIAPSS